MRTNIYDEAQDSFREMIRDFIAKEVVPVHAEWEAEGAVPKEFYRRMGELGIIGIQVPEEFGGGGETTFKYAAVIIEETAAAGVTFGGFSVHANLVLPYLLSLATEEQKQRWLPDFASGERMFGIAMTEPGTGSDLSNIATKAQLSADGTHYVLDGAKTFITGGAQADSVLVVCRTAPYDPANRRAGLSILVVDSASEGFEVGRKLSKIGQRASDTAELSFSGVKVPVENLLGVEGEGFSYLGQNLPQERLAIALGAAASAEAAIKLATDYTREREVFGQPVASFQNTKFEIAACSAEATASRLFADSALEALDRGELSVADAARAKLFCTEVAARVIDRCLQLHGGYGYITEYPIARLYADTRVTRIYGGTSEVMKTIIAKDLGL